MFTKDDLKTGMFVKLRNGKLGIIVNDDIVLQVGTYMPLCEYDESLEYLDDTTYSIIEVRSGGVIHAYFECFNAMNLKYKRNFFTLDKIEDGDIVVTTYSNSNSYITYTTEYKYCKVGTVLVSLDENYESISISNFTEDLKHKNLREVIVKVYRCNTADDYNTLSHCNLVYERED